MSPDPSSPNVPLTQLALVQQIVESVCGKMVVNGAPLDWTLIDLTWSMVGRGGELEIGVETVDGPFTDWLDQPIGFPPGLQQLRDLMYVPGEGTWFTLHLLIRRDGQVSRRFGYDRPEPSVYFESDVEDELRMYPRATVPQWMYDTLHQRTTVEERSIVNESSPTHGSSVGGFGSPRTDRSAAIAAATDFRPSEPDMRYIKVIRPGAVGDEPSVTWSELLEDGSEWRKVQKFADGRTGLAGGLIATDLTWLEDESFFETFSADPSVQVIEVAPSEFQTEWLAAGGWHIE
ncbi:DUF6881 domain-containing protein [Nocardia tengchongensis]|uniref:DUF6881 domain-containing protein n=1 Tax=Nocardia tengchongensis TaxID=2055889 RepID=UPI0036BE070E